MKSLQISKGLGYIFIFTYFIWIHYSLQIDFTSLFCFHILIEKLIEVIILKQTLHKEGGLPMQRCIGRCQIYVGSDYVDVEMDVGKSVMRDALSKALLMRKGDDVGKGLLPTHCSPTWLACPQWWTIDVC